MADDLPKRTRLKPEDRKESILDHAARIVAADGVAALTMDSVGKHAGVSKSLVYAYYPNVTELLKALLKREMRRLRRLQAKAVENAETFEDLVRQVTREYLKYIEDRGLLIQRLQSEPTVSEGLGGPTSYDREIAVETLADIVVENFGLPKDLARATIDISFGLPEAAGNYLHHSGEDRKKVEDLTVTMIIGTLKEVQASYTTKLMPLKRS